jgi:hypothetical protein
MMYRTGFGPLEEQQLSSICNGPKEIADWCASYDESPVGAPIDDCPQLGTSVASLNKLYYFSRIIADRPALQTIVDFGGGYGLMAHILAQLIEPMPTLIIVDLPELLALQYIFLRASGIPVAPHTKAGAIAVEEARVNLVPAQNVANAAFECDLFLSTFALSETPRALQRLVADRHFFGAGSLYIVGQHVEAELWEQYAFEPMDAVRKAAHEQFSHVSEEPFPVVSAWELRAHGRRGA